MVIKTDWAACVSYNTGATRYNGHNSEGSLQMVPLTPDQNKVLSQQHVVKFGDSWFSGVECYYEVKQQLLATILVSSSSSDLVVKAALIG